MIVLREQAIPCDEKLRLDVQKEFVVTVHAHPATSGVNIRGFATDGSLVMVEARGAAVDVTLPFAKPEIYIQRLPGLIDYRIGQGARMTPLARL